MPVKFWPTLYQRLVRFPWRRLTTLASALLLLFFVWYIVRQFRTSDYDFWLLVQSLTVSTLFILFALYSVALVLALWAWTSMMSQVAKPVPWPTHWYIYTVTNVTRRLPGSLWHVAGRTVLYHQRGVARRAVALVSGLEVAFTMMSGSLVLLLTWPAIATHFEGQWQGVVLVIGILVGGTLLLHPASWRRFRQLSGSLTSDTQPFSLFVGLKWLLAYGVVWVVGGLMVVVLANQFHPLPLSTWPAVIGSWVFASLLGILIMILPSGLGVTDLSLTLMLSFYMPTPIAALSALGARLMFTLFELIFALIWGGLYRIRGE